ncbi:DUF4214 domain-containing protein [Undibacterium flavidum]|uniref:DUF4214 domain-containing protein n=1 Tax=Undibacterium flavidum TaxID=2762297 RepID=A0ABR6YAZ5_9BURK|nr:DUF4214 domain-containing protein [Undibacterium flavidum]MBC3873785.1 DUF4214 domain-containing protein [Undibacterium flavidum]
MSLRHRTIPSSLIASSLAILLSACGGESNQHDATLGLQAAPMAAAPSTPTSFPNARNNYLITRTATGFEVRDLIGITANVQVAANASLVFSDMTVNLMIGEQSKTLSATNLRTLIELYIAFFNRVPEADGLGYWIQQMKAGMTVDQLANNFYAAAVQYTTLTGYSSTMTNAEFVKIIYKNVLGRSGSTAPPDADVNYWAGELASGKASKGTLVTTMLNSAHSFVGDATWGWVPQLLDNKIAVGSYFAIEQGLGYVNPNDAISKGIAIAALVTSNNTAAAKTLINVTDTNFNLLMTAPTGSGTGNSRDCFNANLYKAGTVYRTEMSSTYTSNNTSSTETYAVTYTMNGNTTFKGITAQELVADTLSLTGIGTGATSQMKSYIVVTNDEIFIYGNVLNVKVNTTTNYVVTSSMTPPVRTPISLPVNQAYQQTYTVSQEMAGNPTSLPVHTTTESLTFLGTESVTVPAGTFKSCKMKHIDTENGKYITSYSWLIAEGQWRGMLAKVEAVDAVTVATKLSIN